MTSALTQRVTPTFNELPGKPVLVKGAKAMEAVDVCYQCPEGTPLSSCVNQSHWERRLKDYRLGMRRLDSKEVTNADGQQQQVMVQLDKNPDTLLIGPIVVPDDPELAEVFVMDALGVSYPRPPRRFWPFSGEVNRSAFIKTGRMGRIYGQELPSDR